MMLIDREKCIFNYFANAVIFTTIPLRPHTQYQTRSSNEIMWMKKMLAFTLLILACSNAIAQDITSQGNKTALNFIESIQFNFTGSKTVTPTIKDSSISMTAAVTASLKQGLNAALETFLPFQFKYAILLNESVEKVTNLLLYKTIDEWYGTRYRWGGNTNRGIDCS